MTQEVKYDPSKPIPTLEQLLLVPIQGISPKALEDLKARRKYLADIFFSQKSVQEKKDVQDELAKLHKYLGYKEIRKLGEKQPFTKRVITVEERQANCDSFVKYIGSRNLEDPTITVDVLAKIWAGSY